MSEASQEQSENKKKKIGDQILDLVSRQGYEPQKPRNLAKELKLESEADYADFREALRDLVEHGRTMFGARGTVVVPTQRTSRDEILGTYRHNKRGFGFVVPTDPASHEDLYIPQGENAGAMGGDIVRARITSRRQSNGKTMFTGRVSQVVERKSKRFTGTLSKVSGEWFVLPDGNTLTAPIHTPDAASKHIKVGTKVVVELTNYGENGERLQGVIDQVLGQAGEKDVDLKGIVIQYGLPDDFPDEVRDQARAAVDGFKPTNLGVDRYDLTDEIICTIDPDDAKDYDDAISLRRVDDDLWELGVHIADVSNFVKTGSVLDVEARERGNSTYFPGFVIPMLPEILSNGVCSLQEGVPRFCKSAFITYDKDFKPVRSKFANTVIKSRRRLRYTEAQDIIDNKQSVRHPDGAKKLGDYEPEVVSLLHDMNQLSRALQMRRRKQGQINLDLPEVKLVLDESGKVIDAVEEDDSFTHTLIEMFMVEANEAVARLLDSVDVPFLRRTHPTPDLSDSERLRHFTEVSGHKLPKEMDRHAIQVLLEKIKGTPEAFAINLAVLKSLTRAEYSPQVIGHFALASEHYCHFTSPIRRYADLTIHRLLDAYFLARGKSSPASAEASGARTDVGAEAPDGARKRKLTLDDIPSNSDLVELGKHLSFTERRSEDAERELRRVKILELMAQHIGEDFKGVVTGLTGFGVFVQLDKYLNDGLIRYEDLMDDWWDVDERSGIARGKRSGQRIAIGDVVTARVVRVDVPRRELSLAIVEVIARAGRKVITDNAGGSGGGAKSNASKSKHAKHKMKRRGGGGGTKSQPARGGASRGKRGRR